MIPKPNVFELNLKYRVKIVLKTNHNTIPKTLLLSTPNVVSFWQLLFLFVFATFGCSFSSKPIELCTPQGLWGSDINWSNYSWWMKDSTHKSDFDTKMKDILRTGTQNVLVWTGLPGFTSTRFQASSVDLQRSYQFLWIGWSGVLMNTQEHAQPRRIDWPLVTQLHSNWKENHLVKFQRIIIHHFLFFTMITSSIYKPKIHE